MSDSDRRIDLLCAGRLGVDLYGEQDGASLASAQSFVKYLGGSAGNVCVGSARLGLSTAMCSRVGDEGFGQFVLETLERESVETSLVQRDPLHPTGVVALSLNKREGFPRIFFYTDSADLSFDESTIDWSVVERSDALLLTGSYLVNAELESCSHALANRVRGRRGRVLLDIDYRPVLWRLVPVGSGNEMETSAPHVSEVYQHLLPLCDLVVGTTEEISVAGGSSDLLTSLQKIRDLTSAVVVVKNGAAGATVYGSEIPPDLNNGVSAPGYDVEVLNSTGAGDAFLSGFLSRWLRDRPVDECVRAGNACGAIVVTRHGCMPAMAFSQELELFMSKGGVRRPDDDDEIRRVHDIGSRRTIATRLLIVSLGDGDLSWDVPPGGNSGVGRLKELLVTAASRVAESETKYGTGVVVDRLTSREALEEALGSRLFVLKNIDRDDSRTTDYGWTGELGAELRTWPLEIVARARAREDSEKNRSTSRLEINWTSLCPVVEICRREQREILVDLCSIARREVMSITTLLENAYDAGLQPDYWSVPAIFDPDQQREVDEVILTCDPSCRGYFSVSRDSRQTVEILSLSNRSLLLGVITDHLADHLDIKKWTRGEMSDPELIDIVSQELLGFHVRIDNS